MPQKAWEAVLRDGVQGIRRPYTPETLRRWLQNTHPRARAIGAPLTSPPPHLQHTGKGNGRREGPRQGGEERPKVTGRRSQGHGTGGNTTWGQRTTRGPPKTRKGKARGPDTGGEGTTMGTRTRTTKEGHNTPEGPSLLHPPQASRQRETNKEHGHTEAQGGPPRRRARAKTRRCSPNLSPQYLAATRRAPKARPTHLQWSDWPQDGPPSRRRQRSRSPHHDAPAHGSPAPRTASTPDLLTRTAPAPRGAARTLQGPSPATPATPSASTRATAVPCPRPPSPTNGTALPVPRLTPQPTPPPLSLP